MYDQLAAQSARQMVITKCGDISDLPEKARDTIAYIFYQLALIQKSPSAGIFDRGLSSNVVGKSIDETTFIIYSAKTIPSMAEAIRKNSVSNESRSDLQFLVEVFLLMFRYRVPNVSKKPLWVGQLLKPFYRKNAKATDGFYKLIANE